jgi:hypothetical protein
LVNVSPCWRKRLSLTSAMEDKLDQYLRQANKELNRKVTKPKKARKPKATRQTALKRWAASAAMDLFKIYFPLIMLAVFGGIMLMVEISIAKYCFYASAVVTVIGLLYSALDYYHYSTWTSKLSFKLEGWNDILNSRSPSYWDMNGEHWLPVKIVVVMKGPANEKHVAVIEAFLKKLRKRLNQWTVSSEKHFGYSQPNGWAHDGLILAGDMNPRVMNLIRKQFSRELDRLSKLMPEAIEKVMISQTGKETYHEVYVDPAD